LKIKGNLLTDVFNIIGVKRFDRKKESINKMKNRMKNNSAMKTGMARQGTMAKSNQPVQG